MNRKGFLEFHDMFCEAARKLSEKKNSDYAGGDGRKPFANFERVEALGICSTERGFLVRMADKLSRLSTFADTGKLCVEDEGPMDTLLDLANYSILLAAYIQQKGEHDLTLEG